MAGRERRDRVPVLPAPADAVGARERGAAARLRAAAARSASASSAPATTSSWSASATSSTICRPSSRAASSSESRSRAPLASDPKLVVGDEPTGNLDTVTAAEMFELFERLNGEGKTILYVTHDLELARRAHRVVTIRDGVVVAS